MTADQDGAGGGSRGALWKHTQVVRDKQASAPPHAFASQQLQKKGGVNGLSPIPIFALSETASPLRGGTSVVAPALSASGIGGLNDTSGVITCIRT